jgi:hypothetical protein
MAGAGERDAVGADESAEDGAGEPIVLAESMQPARITASASAPAAR